MFESNDISRHMHRLFVLVFARKKMENMRENARLRIYENEERY